MKRPQCLLLTTLTLRGSIDTMFCDLADALRRLGVYTRAVVDVPQAPNVALAHGLVGELRDYDGPRFIIDVNAKSRLTGQAADGGAVFIHDAWNIPRVSIFESNPIHNLSQLEHRPRNLAITVIDDAHRRVFETFAIAPRAIGFLPHAGPPPLAHILPMAERPIDVLFIGNVKDVLSPDEWVAQLACLDALKTAALHVIARRWEPADDDTATMLAGVLKEDGIAAEPRRDLALAATIELYVNNLKRRELLGALRHHRVVVCGEVETRLSHVETISVTGPQSFSSALQLMDNAKLVLNTMPFRSGAHERVFYGLSRGAAILSDYSRLLVEPAMAQAGIAFFPRDPAALDDAIAALLEAPLDEAVAEGRHWYGERHTWDHRAAQLVDLVEPLF
ncbi:MAG TPA: glycosyltransferase [Stellaceae bacterium]|jgi:glycosyltransferase involved in cell wall biosynthesis